MCREKWKFETRLRRSSHITSCSTENNRKWCINFDPITRQNTKKTIKEEKIIFSKFVGKLLWLKTVTENSWKTDELSEFIDKRDWDKSTQRPARGTEIHTNLTTRYYRNFVDLDYIKHLYRAISREMFRLLLYFHRSRASPWEWSYQDPYGFPGTHPKIKNPRKVVRISCCAVTLPHAWTAWPNSQTTRNATRRNK